MGSLFVFFFGILGGLCRFALGDFLPAINGFPISTLLVNLLGCFLMMFLTGSKFGQTSPRRNLVLGMSTGFIGSFTTFSTFVLDFSKLLMLGNLWMMFFYIFLSLIGGLIFGYFGLWLSNRLRQVNVDVD
ncbi:MAG: CrcB family protein [Streptococcaceae bacterium]|nr:CrcB family protein [Streptococcaceae bacterium]